jgi:hypothetical protein
MDQSKADTSFKDLTKNQNKPNIETDAHTTSLRPNLMVSFFNVISLSIVSLLVIKCF